MGHPVTAKARRLHQALDGVELTAEDEALIATLAQLPAGDVDQLRSLLARKGRAALAREQEVRRRRRGEALGRRGGFEALYRLEADVAAAQMVAVERMRAEGFSDAEIGAGVGITRQAVRQRVERQRGVVAGPTAEDPPS